MKLHLKLVKFFISAISAVAVLAFASCESTKSAKSQNAIAGARVELVETEPANSSATDEIFKSVLRLDTHLHVDVPMEDKDLPWSEKVDLKSAMEKAGYNVVVMTFAVGYVTLKYPGHAYKRFLNALDAQKKILDDSGLSLTLTSGGA